MTIREFRYSSSLNSFCNISGREIPSHATYILAGRKRLITVKPSSLNVLALHEGFRKSKD